MSGGGMMNGLTGGIGGAGSGAALGTMLMPGIGTAVGAGLGGALGAAPSVMGMGAQHAPTPSGLSGQQMNEHQLNQSLMQKGALSDYLLSKGNEYMPSIK